jgi:REP element-mobilizing transposase RayT
MASCSVTTKSIPENPGRDPDRVRFRRDRLRVMPEHIRLLLSEPEKADLSVVMEVLKQRFAKRVLSSFRQKLAWDGTPR